MLLGQLFHTAIRTADLNATTRFYLEVLGMILAERPPMNFPGAWIRPPTPGGDAIFHIYAGEAAKEADGSVLSGSGAIDHISVQAQGYSQFRERFKKFNLQWRENLVAATPLWQLFIYDPNGIMLELTFHQAAEHEPVPVIPKERQYVPRERWFISELYRQFTAPPAQLDQAGGRSA